MVLLRKNFVVGMTFLGSKVKHHVGGEDKYMLAPRAACFTIHLALFLCLHISVGRQYQLSQLLSSKQSEAAKQGLADLTGTCDVIVMMTTRRYFAGAGGTVAPSACPRRAVDQLQTVCCCDYPLSFVQSSASSSSAGEHALH